MKCVMRPSSAYFNAKQACIVRVVGGKRMACKKKCEIHFSMSHDTMNSSLSESIEY